MRLQIYVKKVCNAIKEGFFLRISGESLSLQGELIVADNLSLSVGVFF